MAQIKGQIISIGIDMKYRHLVEQKEATIELLPDESTTLKNCLDYCKHRLKAHIWTGMNRTNCTLGDVQKLLDKWFPETPTPEKAELPEEQSCATPEELNAYSGMANEINAIRASLNLLIRYLKEKE